MVNHVGADWLAQKITTECDRVLLLDTRDPDEFATGYICGAVSVFASSLAFRRLQKGRMGIENLISETVDKEKFQASKQSEDISVVLYDEDSLDSCSVNEGSLIYTLLSRACKDCKNVMFLEGGFKAFVRQARKLCILAEKSQSCPTTPTKSPKCTPKLISRPSFLSLQLKRLSLEDSSEEPSATPFSGDRAKPVEVLPHLYLGDIQIARNRDVLKRYDITKILNVSKLDNSFESEKELEYKQIAVEDAPDVNLSEHFPDAFRFIESARQGGERVLVHCHAGMSRSVTVILAYLMQTEGYTLDKAYDFVKDKKPNIQPNFSFMGQLLDFERSRTPDSGIDSSDSREFVL